MTENADYGKINESVIFIKWSVILCNDINTNIELFYSKNNNMLSKKFQ